MKNLALAGIFNPALYFLAKQRIKTWNSRLKPLKLQATQESVLYSLCQQARSTEFGKKYNFKNIKSYSDFKNTIPVQDYAGFEPYLQRMRQGEHNILWPGLISYYGQSSGTSGTAAQHKFLPISQEQIRWQQKAAFDILARYLILNQDSNFLGGYALGLFPPSVLKPEVPGVFTGSNPGIMFRNLPLLAKPAAIPKKPIRDIIDYDQKLEKIAQNYASYDVRALSGTTCWFSIFFDKLLKHTGAQNVSQIWPNLRVLFGGGIQAAPYKEIIKSRVGKDIILMDNYNATEGGLFSVTDSFEDDALLMMPDRGVFFEFVKRTEHGLENPKRYALWEVEAHTDYSVVLSTASGLFAYSIGDFVRFSSLYPHRMHFVGRPSGVLSLTQELMTYSEIEKAVCKAQKQVPCSIIDYSVGPELGIDGTSKGRYRFWVEFEQKPSDMTLFIQSIDKELASLNRVYREHRTADVAILCPALTCLKSGSMQMIMKSFGFHSVQNKFPRIISTEKQNLIAEFIE